MCGLTLIKQNVQEFSSYPIANFFFFFLQSTFGHFKKRMELSHHIFFLPCSLFPHTPDVFWALISTTASPLRMAGLCYLEDACMVLFVQVAPSTHTVKSFDFCLWRRVQILQHISIIINGIYFNSMQKKSWCWWGLNHFPLKRKFPKRMLYHLS